MNKYILIILAVIIFLPAPVPWMDGAYNKISGLFWCSSTASCAHEIAHKIDDESGWISHDPEFREAVETLAGYEIDPGFMNKNMEEVYAGIFERAEGKKENMPEKFHRFYDWDRAQELIETIVPDHKVIIWTCFKANYKMLERTFKELGVDYVMITGEQSTAQKNEAMERFQNCYYLPASLALLFLQYSFLLALFLSSHVLCNSLWQILQFLKVVLFLLL